MTVLLKPFNICLHNIFKRQLNLSKEILQLDLEFIVVQDRKAYTLCAAFASKKEAWCQWLTEEVKHNHWPFNKLLFNLYGASGALRKYLLLAEAALVGFAGSTKSREWIIFNE